MFEVICISEIDGSFADFNGNLVPDDDSPNPIKGEVYKVDLVINFPDGDYYILNGFSESDCFHSRNFERIDGLQGEITEALKARNPNIRKFSLHELDAIGYYIPNYKTLL